MAWERIPTSEKIVCVRTEEPHRHIVSVGVGGDAQVPIKTMTVTEVRDAITAGGSFHTVSPSTSQVAAVRKATCGIPGCHMETIRSSPDAVTDNNLDELDDCP
jgi:hypothetical protein